MRRGMTVAGLVLVLAALTPAGASAKQGGKERPLKIRSSGTTISTITPSGQLAGHQEGTFVGIHLGSGTYAGESTTVPTGPNTISYSGTVVFTAANGDELFVSGVGTGTFTSQCLTSQPGCTSSLRVIETITGGTGRFKGASGTAIDLTEARLLSATATTTTFGSDDVMRGTISY